MIATQSVAYQKCRRYICNVCSWVTHSLISTFIGIHLYTASTSIGANSSCRHIYPFLYVTQANYQSACDCQFLSRLLSPLFCLSCRSPPPRSLSFRWSSVLRRLLLPSFSCCFAISITSSGNLRYFIMEPRIYTSGIFQKFSPSFDVQITSPLRCKFIQVSHEAKFPL